MTFGNAIWATALVAYILFRLWYDNLRGPLSKAEVEAIMAELGGRAEQTGTTRETLRSFLATDDGREFVMVNLVKVHEAPVTDPDSGAPVSGLELLKRYSRGFIRILVRNAGHPGIVGRKVGGYMDAWNTQPDPGWTVFGLVRYRSRRDMIKLVLNPAFKAGHPAKVAGTAATFSFPAQRIVSIYTSPRLTVGLAIALAAALAHLGVALQSG